MRQCIDKIKSYIPESLKEEYTMSMTFPVIVWLGAVVVLVALIVF